MVKLFSTYQTGESRFRKTGIALPISGDSQSSDIWGTKLPITVGDKINSMTIGWGTMGVVWEKPIFVAYVRDC
ncbi:MAG: hypothetical protein IJK44_09980, partial [Bacteroidales bacterium]|nr:hypothetical protein [Bacteroidales bacterium]